MRVGGGAENVPKNLSLDKQPRSLKLKSKSPEREADTMQDLRFS